MYLIVQRIEPINILDVLVDTENWLDWTKSFGPLSGYDGRIDDARERYVTTTFCYGCGLGPSQTSQCVPGTERRQLAWANQRHITEERIEEAITEVINRYNLFRLPGGAGVGGLEHTAGCGTHENRAVVLVQGIDGGDAREIGAGEFDCGQRTVRQLPLQAHRVVANEVEGCLVGGSRGGR